LAANVKACDLSGPDVTTVTKLAAQKLGELHPLSSLIGLLQLHRSRNRDIPARPYWGKKS